MELVHPESKLYGVKFIRWMAHRIKNHLHGRDLFYDEFKDPQPAAPEKPKECEECAEMHNEWMCTKDKGHTDDHEAGGPGNKVIYATWPNVPKAPTPFDNILIVHECKVPRYNRISIPMKLWKDVQMHQRHWKGEKIRITIEKI
jgi:hypothetical protein